MGSDSVNVVSVVDGKRHNVISRRLKFASYFSIVCAGAAMISDGYQNNCMTMANALFSIEYKTAYTSTMKTRVSNSLFVGEIFGQIAMGLVCDYFGRKVALVATTLLIVIGSILATAAHGTSTTGMFWMIMVARGIIGFGIGGEYPVSSTSASEAANEAAQHLRAPITIMVTEFPLAIGGPLSISIFLIIYSAAGIHHLSTIWRVYFGLGCIFPLVVFYFRLKLVTSKLYKEEAIKKRVPYLLVIRYYWKTLLGTAGSWFVFDFVTYPNSIFSATIISEIVPDSSSNLLKTGEWDLLLTSLAIPGVLVGAYLYTKIGARNTMILGFMGYIVFGLVIGCGYDKIVKIVPLFVIFYGIMNSLAQMGPGCMTIVASAESYATGVRGTCFGLSAAIGKVGAVVGTQTFTSIQNHLGKKWTFIIAAICGLVGVIITFFCVPKLNGEDLMDEDERFHKYLVANNWEGSFGDGESSDMNSEDIEKLDSIILSTKQISE
ncbi:major facilitator superfamily domain-containing protein [Lipomyces orientalis]|uniref:Major facilitator superfamily domain-containing protein n=1 Tax=Lipomyces orientalis TaxID=1233043 RepID=A0ACC3THV3_9ASCO